MRPIISASIESRDARKYPSSSIWTWPILQPYTITQPSTWYACSSHKTYEGKFSKKCQQGPSVRVCMCVLERVCVRVSVLVRVRACFYARVRVRVRVCARVRVRVYACMHAVTHTIGTYCF